MHEHGFAIIWGLTALLVLIVMLYTGTAITGRPFGILIDSRAKMSLSRLQLVLWTWLFVSSFFAIAIRERTMGIVMAPELWALMGISIGSAAGAVIVKGTKEAKQPAATVAAQARAATRRGLMAVNSDATAAKLSDMFKGEEVTDADYVDISKLQMFFFTLAAWFGYIWVLWSAKLAVNHEGLVVMPELSTSLVTLIAISHAGYLTIKSAPKTPVA